MEIIKIVGIAIVCAVCFVILKDSRPEIAMLIAIAGSVVILWMVVDYAVKIIGAVSGLVSKTGLDPTVFANVLKMIGIGYVTEFGASLCTEVGAKSIADKVLFGGKILIFALSLPILMSLFQLIAELV